MILAFRMFAKFVEKPEFVVSKNIAHPGSTFDKAYAEPHIPF